MGDSVTVIDIVAQVTDETARGTQSSTKNVSKLEQSMRKLQKQLDSMRGKSKIEVKAGCCLDGEINFPMPPKAVSI